MVQILPIIMAGLLACSTLYGQARPKSAKLTELYPFEAGDTMIYQATAKGTSEIVFGFTAGIDKNGQSLFRMQENRQGVHQLLELNASKGLYLHELTTADGAILTFQKPLRILPAELQIGHSYEYNATFVKMKNGKQTDTGKQKTRIRFLGYDSAYTPFQNFAQCAVMAITTTRTYEGSGDKLVIQTKQWHAEGVGLVKMAGKTSDGNAISMRLQSSKIGGIWIESAKNRKNLKPGPLEY